MSLGELAIEFVFEGDVKKAETFKKTLDDISSSMKNITKGIGNSSKNIASLLTGVSNIAKHIGTVIFTAAKQIMAIVGSLTLAYAAALKLADGLTKANQTWIDFSRQTDLSMSKLQGYSTVTNILDKTLGIEGAAQEISDLEQRLYRLSLTGEGAQGFLLAGINPMGKNAFQILEDLRQRIKGLNNDQASFLLQQMGINPKMLGMLRMTKDEFEALNNTMRQYQFTPEQREAMQKLSQQLTVASIKITYFREKIVLALLPSLTKLTKVLVSVAEAFMNIMKSNSGIAILTKSVLGLVAAVTALGAAIWAVTAHPIVALITLIAGIIMATIAGLFLIIDDFIAWSEGRNSILGVILYQLDQIVNNENVPKWLRYLVYVMEKMPYFANSINKVVGNIEASGNILSGVTKSSMAASVLSLNPSLLLSSDFRNFAMSGVKDLKAGVTKAINISQTNNIVTSETADTVQQELEHLRTLDSVGE